MMKRTFTVCPAEALMETIGKDNATNRPVRKILRKDFIACCCVSETWGNKFQLQTLLVFCNLMEELNVR